MRGLNSGFIPMTARRKPNSRIQRAKSALLRTDIRVISGSLKNTAQEAFVSDHFHALDAALDRTRQERPRQAGERRGLFPAEDDRAECDVHFVYQPGFEQAPEDNAAAFANEALHFVARAKVLQHLPQ